MKINFEGRTGNLLYAFLGILLAFVIYLALTQVLSTDMPLVAVESNSMAPTFYKGDALIIQGVRNPEDYLDFLEIGDVIVFSVEERVLPVVHRINETNPDGSFQTKGDASRIKQSFEKHIEPEQIHGKVVSIIPYLGWVRIGLTKYVLPFFSENMFLVIAVILAVVGVYFYIFKGQGRRSLRSWLKAGTSPPRCVLLTVPKFCFL
jgi:signal peptidase I